MENIFIKIIETSIIGTISGLIILLLRVILKNKINRRWIYLLWIIVIIKLMVPFGPKSNLSIFNSFNNIKISTNTNSNVNTNINSYINTESDYVNNNDNTTNNIDTPKYNSKETDKFNIMNFMSNIWCVTFVTLSVVFLSTYFIMKNKIKQSCFTYDKKLKEILIKYKNKLKIKADVNIIVNDYIKTPAIIGIFKPTILIPINTEQLESKELEYIFIHELAHLKRKDNIINFLLTINQCIHWFNPFIWYMSKIIRQDMELATDELVLSTINHDEYKNYGLTILNISSNLNKYKTNTRILCMSNDKKDLEDRILNIKFLEKINKRKAIYTIVGVILVTLMGIFIITSPENNKQSNTELSKMQNLYFELVSALDEKNIDSNEVKSIIVNSGLEGITEKSEIIDLKNKTEHIEVSLNDKKNVYGIKYKNDKNIGLSYENPKVATEIGNEDKYSISLDNLSASNLEKVINNLDSDISQNKLFNSYIEILKLSESDKLTKEKVLKINPNLTQPKGKNQLQNVLSSSDDHYRLSSVYNGDNELLYISFNNKDYSMIFDLYFKKSYSNKAYFKMKNKDTQRDMLKKMY